MLGVQSAMLFGARTVQVARRKSNMMTGLSHFAYLIKKVLLKTGKIHINLATGENFANIDVPHAVRSALKLKGVEKININLSFINRALEPDATLESAIIGALRLLALNGVKRNSFDGYRTTSDATGGSADFRFDVSVKIFPAMEDAAKAIVDIKMDIRGMG